MGSFKVKMHQEHPLPIPLH